MVVKDRGLKQKSRQHGSDCHSFSPGTGTQESQGMIDFPEKDVALVFAKREGATT